MNLIDRNFDAMRRIAKELGIGDGAPVSRIVLDFEAGSVTRAYVQMYVGEGVEAAVVEVASGVEVTPVAAVAIDDTGNVTPINPQPLAPKARCGTKD